MKLIERYIHAVKQHLPADLREDIGKELRTNIEDMLPVNYTENDVYNVLIELGSPFKLASEYNPQKRYLIGPGYYDKFISTLKMVIGICVAVFVGIAFLVWIVEQPVDSFSPSNVKTLIVDFVSAAVSGAFQGAFWVTLVFIILERSGAEDGSLPFHNKKWTPDDLPEVDGNDKKKISRGETVFSIFATILFTALIYFQPQLLALYLKGDTGSINITPVFDLERLRFYIPFILLMSLVQLGMFVWKYITGSWNVPLVIANTIFNAAACILAILMLTDASLFNSQFITAIADLANTSVLIASSWALRIRWIIGAVIIGSSIIDSIIPFYKCFSKGRVG